jgi:hypothetical protein
LRYVLLLEYCAIRSQAAGDATAKGWRDGARNNAKARTKVWSRDSLAIDALAGTLDIGRLPDSTGEAEYCAVLVLSDDETA